VSLKSSLNWGLSDNLKKAFPNVVSVNRPEYEFKGISDPNWVAGFTSGDGSFQIIINQENPAVETGNVRLRFAISLNIREKDLIKGLVLFFKSYDVKSSDLSVNTISKNYYIAGEENKSSIFCAGRQKF